MRAARRRRDNDAGAILVFGESINDSQSVLHLLVAANRDLDRRVRAFPRPVSLTREAKPEAVRRWTDELARAVRAYEVTGTVSAVVVHRDADGPDPDRRVPDRRVSDRPARDLGAIGGTPVVPVQAIEAWWFLFPDAVEAVRPGSWRGTMPRQARDVEHIDGPKDALRRTTRTKRAPEYAESDSPIARNIRDHGASPLHTCASYEAMTSLARTIR